MKPSKMSVWNNQDEFALLAGLAHWTTDKKTLEYVRYPTETNKLLKDRIIQANKYRGNATLQGMINNISRDLSVFSPSGDYVLDRYNVVTKAFFYLSEKPYPGPSGVRVYVSTSGTWTSADEITTHVRASGYIDALSGWIVWNLPDYDPTQLQERVIGSSGWYINTNQEGMFASGVKYGEYTQILEFISGSIPATASRVRVDYQVQTGMDSLGQPVLNWRSDFSNPDDPTDLAFIGSKSEFPDTPAAFDTFRTSHISILSLDDLDLPAVSGYFYEEDGRAKQRTIKIKDIVNERYPLQWGSFRYDTARWDQLDEAAVGEIPSFHDETILPLSGVGIVGGSRYGVGLGLTDLKPEASGTRSRWFPVFVPGEFEVGNERFYLFGSQQSQKLDLTAVGDILSGALTGSSSGWPLPLGLICANSSGVFYNDANLPNNIYVKRLHDFVNVISGVFYRRAYPDYGSGVAPTALDYDSGRAFYYKYNTGEVFASGVDPNGFVVIWEHPDVYGSGIYLTYSGGYGFSVLDFNPITNPDDKIVYIQ